MLEKTIADSSDIETILVEYSRKIYADYPDIENFAIVGVQTRGVELAERIKSEIEKLSGKSVRLGTLDINLFRDDLATRGVLPEIKETRIEFDITRSVILLVDDVIFTGRTMKAAIENLMTFGRPSAIRLFELIDRGNRELPIQPDYCGFKIETGIEDDVRVKLRGTDSEDDRIILKTAE